MGNDKERLDRERIAALLGETPVTLRIYDVIDSTNNEAKRYAMDGGAAPAVLLAEGQTAGRGRMGRSFYSPDGVGIYLSLLFPLQGALADGVRLTSAAAVAVHRAILQVTGIETGIKWVNDLYLGDRKVCGILAESFPVGEVRYAVLGVGVNLYTEEFPPELSGIAGALLPSDTGLRNALAAAMSRELTAVVNDPEGAEWLSVYRERSICLGREVTYTQNGEVFCGMAEEIDGQGRLWVRREDGARVCLGSGEISLRTIK